MPDTGCRQLSPTPNPTSSAVAGPCRAGFWRLEVAPIHPEGTFTLGFVGGFNTYPLA